MNTLDIDQHKLQMMASEAEAARAMYNSLSDRSLQMPSLIENAKRNLKAEKENQENSKDVMPNMPAFFRNRGASDIKPIPAHDYSKRVEEAQEKLDQILNERATLQQRMNEVGAKSSNFSTTLREVNRALLAENIEIQCLERFS